MLIRNTPACKNSFNFAHHLVVSRTMNYFNKITQFICANILISQFVIAFSMELVPYGFPLAAPRTNQGTAIINPIYQEEYVPTALVCPKNIENCETSRLGYEVSRHFRANLPDDIKQNLYWIFSERRFCQIPPFYAIIDSDPLKYKTAMETCKNWFNVHHYGRSDYYEIFNDMFAHLKFILYTEDINAKDAMSIVRHMEDFVKSTLPEETKWTENMAIRLTLLVLNHHKGFPVQRSKNDQAQWNLVEGSILNLIVLLHSNDGKIMESQDFLKSDKELIKTLLTQYKDMEKFRKKWEYFYQLYSNVLIYGGSTLVAMGLTLGAALPFLP